MWEIAGVIAGILALFIATLTYLEKKKNKRIVAYEKRKDEKEKERELKDELRMANFRGGLTEEIANILNLKLSGYESVEEARASYTKIWNKLNKIDEELGKHFEDSNKVEMNRLAQEIISFADDLRNGQKKFRTSYQYIACSHDKYKELGGNTYVDEQFEYITEQMKDTG